ncbi:hypothetical protein EVAR_29344_1 [Eumeta japonica]|uniref:Uncharacterized protein n=1 Tax=Eumeta variegata TaxID=151549 RepID=A0A4C1WKE4_EUMVA|nr:hypothetical protein EVAR_29344_1 [Eumeta japonica]
MEQKDTVRRIEQRRLVGHEHDRAAGPFGRQISSPTAPLVTACSRAPAPAAASASSLSRPPERAERCNIIARETARGCGNPRRDPWRRAAHAIAYVARAHGAEETGERTNSLDLLSMIEINILYGDMFFVSAESSCLRVPREKETSWEIRLQIRLTHFVTAKLLDPIGHAPHSDLCHVYVPLGLLKGFIMTLTPMPAPAAVAVLWCAAGSMLMKPPKGRETLVPPSLKPPKGCETLVPPSLSLS